MPRLKDIAKAIEEFAPCNLQESYDNSGIQVGDPDMEITAALLCLDINEEILEEAITRHCNLIVSHHPLIFHGLKQLTGKNMIQRVVMKAVRENIAIYSAHTNLDSTWEGVSHEMAHILKVQDIEVLSPHADNPKVGLGVIGTVKPTPKIEFLRKIKDAFNVKCLRFSSQTPRLVVRKVAVCGGAGASFIKDAIAADADIIVTGDVKYHDFSEYGWEIIIADIGHYESELCATKILSRVLREKFPDFNTYFSAKETNPINFL